MKKKNVLNLIKYYSENNDLGFREEAYKIANEFDELGDYQLSQYIMSLLSSTHTFAPQIENNEESFFRKVELNNKPLPLPTGIKEDVVGIINAASHGIGVNKFLFVGSPGTGKTETVKQIARLLERQIFMVEFESVIDSKLGQTSKNLKQVFDEMHSLHNPSKVVILFDEIDSIAMDRINTNDLREMGRVTSTLIKEMDKLKDEILLIATTNLYNTFDKALTRRFDSVIDFNRYTREDLIEVAESILNSYLKKFKNLGKNMKLFKKIMNLYDEIPYPGDLENIIKTSLAFSNPNNEFDYLKKILNSIYSSYDSKKLKSLGFTLREIEILTGISKSQVSREMKE